jgi:hypothetical protein
LRKNGTKKHFVAGQAVTETVDTIHRGITRNQPVVLIVFYPGTPGMPLSQEAAEASAAVHAARAD